MIALMSEQKRARCRDFNEFETNLLADLVTQYRDKLENKKTDARTSREKDLCWQIVSDEFNASSGTTFRAAFSLKIKYENLKKKYRKELADEKCQLPTTSAGTVVAPKKDPVLEKIRQILSSPVQRPNPHDSDTAVLIKQEAASPEDGEGVCFGDTTASTERMETVDEIADGPGPSPRELQENQISASPLLLNNRSLIAADTNLSPVQSRDEQMSYVRSTKKRRDELTLKNLELELKIRKAKLLYWQLKNKFFKQQFRKFEKR